MSSAAPAKLTQRQQNLVAVDTCEIRRSKAERWHQISQDAIAATELVMNHILATVRENPRPDRPGEGWRTLKDATTVFAILVDKGRVLEDLLSHLDGRGSNVSVSEAVRKAGEVQRVLEELERRNREPVDVTPPKPEP